MAVIINGITININLLISVCLLYGNLLHICVVICSVFQSDLYCHYGGIKFNSLYMPLLNDDYVTFILDFFVVVVITAIFSFLL